MRRFLQSNLQIAPEALDYIVNLPDPVGMTEFLIPRVISMDDPNGVSVISLELVKLLLNDTHETDLVGTDPPLITNDLHPQEPFEVASPLIHVSDSPVSIVKSPDPYSVGCAGVVDDFIALFTDRLQRIRRMFMTRIDTHGAISTVDAISGFSSIRRGHTSRREQGSTRGAQVKIIGMVKDKSVSRSHNILFELEDTEGSILCVIPAGRKNVEDQELLQKGNMILPDEVICVSGHVDRDGFLIVEDISFPDIPTIRNTGQSQRDIYAVFLSDLHIGSNEFLEDTFDGFLKWLNGHNISERDRSIVNQIGYVLIAGDLCDGIGVYPDQERFLTISSIYNQYEFLADKLKTIPCNIRIIFIPGNHDASRQALPRPPIPQEFAAALYELDNRVVAVGDPCHINIEGVNILMTHGDSLDDLVLNVPGISYRYPAQAMSLLLRKRHLAPIYGGKTELAPVSRDWMVIDSVPDIIHFGHAHHNAVDNYRGVQIINSGTFQAQTDFMRKQGIMPTPGIVTLVNLRTGTPTLRLFHDGEVSSL